MRIHRRPTQPGANPGRVATVLVVAGAITFLGSPAWAQSNASPPSAADYAQALDAIQTLRSEVNELKQQVQALRLQVEGNKDRVVAPLPAAAPPPVPSIATVDTAPATPVDIGAGQATALGLRH